MNRIKVIAPKGLTCPKQNGRALIGDGDPVEVPDNRYYRRLIADGSLLLNVEKRPAPEKTKKVMKEASHADRK